MNERAYILNGNYQMLDALIAERDRLKRLLVALEKHAIVDWPYPSEARVTFAVITPHPWGVKPRVFQILGTLANQDEEALK